MSVELKQTRTMMPMKGMVSAVARRTERNQVIERVISWYVLFQATLNSRMVTTVYHQIICRTTELTFKTVSLKNRLSVALKTSLLPRFILNLFNPVWGTLPTTLIFSRSILFKLFTEAHSPRLTGSLVKLNSGGRYAGVTELLPSRSRLINGSATGTGLLAVVLHYFRLSLCKGAV